MPQKLVIRLAYSDIAKDGSVAGSVQQSIQYT